MGRITRRALAGGGGLALVGAIAAPALAQNQKLRWRMVTSWPKRLPGPGMSAERIAQRIGALSGAFRHKISAWSRISLQAVLEARGA